VTVLPFSKTQDAAFRRVTRDTIRSAPFTKSERDVVLAFVNHWFNLRHLGHAVYPGRKKLAKKANTSIRTVASVLGILRASGAIVAEAHLNGLHGNATEYSVNYEALIDLCRLSKEQIRSYGVQNFPDRGSAKIAHRSIDSNVVAFPSKRRG
jgi:hypothetical protein